MQKSFVVKAPVHFANFSFFVRIGDILVHDPANGNRLTVFRGGEIVKAITQTSLGMAALLKQGFVSELKAEKTIAPPLLVAIVAPPETEVLRKEIKRKAKAATSEDLSRHSVDNGTLPDLSS